VRGPAPTLHCPRCEDAQPPGASPALVTCRKCGLAFDPAAGTRARTRVDRPPEVETPALETHVGWVRRDAVPMSIAVALSVGAAGAMPGWPGTLMAVLAVPCVYGLLCVAFNVTTIRMDDEAITATTRPFPHWPRRRVPRADIANARYERHKNDGAYDVLIERYSKRTTCLVSIRTDDGEGHARALVSAINERLRPA